MCRCSSLPGNGPPDHVRIRAVISAGADNRQDRANAEPFPREIDILLINDVGELGEALRKERARLKSLAPWRLLLSRPPGADNRAAA